MSWQAAGEASNPGVRPSEPSTILRNYPSPPVPGTRICRGWCPLLGHAFGGPGGPCRSQRVLLAASFLRLVIAVRRLAVCVW